MSSNHDIYFGIYLACSGTEDTEVQGDPYCSNDSTHNVGYGDKFCTKCGNEIRYSVNTRPLQYSDTQDLDDEACIVTKEESSFLDEALFHFHIDDEEETYLVPNSLAVFGKFFDDDEGEIVIDMTTGTISVDIAEASLRKEIRILKDNLYKNVAVRFGYLSRIV